MMRAILPSTGAAGCVEGDRGDRRRGIGADARQRAQLRLVARKHARRARRPPCAQACRLRAPRIIAEPREGLHDLFQRRGGERLDIRPARERSRGNRARRPPPSSAAAGFPKARRDRGRPSRPRAARQGSARRWTSHQARTRGAIAARFEASRGAVYNVGPWRHFLAAARDEKTRPLRAPLGAFSAISSGRRSPRAASARRASSPIGPRSSARRSPALRARCSCNGRRAAPSAIPTSRAAPATLVLRIDGAFALEAQHSSRDDRRAGQCASRLALRRRRSPSGRARCSR